jgi:hypothetical protein
LKQQYERKSHAYSSLARRNSDSTYHFDSAAALSLELEILRVAGNGCANLLGTTHLGMGA